MKFEDLSEKIKRKFIEKTKKYIYILKKRKPNPKLIFILGSGRSGTSMLVNLFQHSIKMDVHGEQSKYFYGEFHFKPN